MTRLSMKTSAIWFTLNLLVALPLFAESEMAVERQQYLLNFLKQDCGSCHGLTMRGGLGPSLLPENLAGKSTEYLTATILDGRPGTAMPPWKPVLSDEDAQWMAERLLQGM
jgi:cytochrome c55X